MTEQVSGHVALALSFLALAVSVGSLAWTVGKHFSTHKIEWRTLGDKDIQDEKALVKALSVPLEDEEYDGI